MTFYRGFSAERVLRGTLVPKPQRRAAFLEREGRLEAKRLGDAERFSNGAPEQTLRRAVLFIQRNPRLIYRRETDRRA
jgi:hypothetical protein